MLSRRVRKAAWILVVLTTGSLLIGCSAEPEVITGIDTVEVSGEFGASPQLTYPKPLEAAKSGSELVWAGDGPKVESGDTILLNVYAQNGLTGSQVMNTFFEVPEIFEVTPESLGKVLYEAVLGEQTGARVLVVDEGGDDFPIVLVLDVLAGQAVGEPNQIEDGLPRVTSRETGEPKVKISKALRKVEPSDLTVRALVRGPGRQVKAGQTVIVQYKALSWSDGKVIDSTWDAGRTPFTTIVGDSRPIPAWDEALIEQSVGSQVLLIAPPDLAYGGSDQPWAEDTIVFVIDILYAGTIDAPKPDEGSGVDEGVDLEELDLDNSTDE